MVIFEIVGVFVTLVLLFSGIKNALKMFDETSNNPKNGKGE